MRVLALGCHPDDIEFGCGGTLSKYADAGHEIYMMVMTRGQAGGDEAIRKREQEEAARIIGCEKLFWGGYRDTELELSRRVIPGHRRGHRRSRAEVHLRALRGRYPPRSPRAFAGDGDGNALHPQRALL